MGQEGAVDRLFFPENRFGPFAALIRNDFDLIVASRTTAFLFQPPNTFPELVDTLGGAGFGGKRQFLPVSRFFSRADIPRQERVIIFHGFSGWQSHKNLLQVIEWLQTVGLGRFDQAVEVGG